MTMLIRMVWSPYILSLAAFTGLFCLSALGPNQAMAQQGWQTVGQDTFSDGRAWQQSLAFHPTTHEPYVAYTDRYNYWGGTVMRYNGSQWVTVGQDSFTDGLAGRPDLAFQPGTHDPHVAYRDEINNDGASVMKFNGSQWVEVGQDSFSDGRISFISLAFDPNTARPYVAYKDKANEWEATVKKFNGSQWVTVGQDSFSDGQITKPSLAFPPNSSNPHVAYGGGNTIGCNVMRFNGSQWVPVGDTGFSEGGAGKPTLVFNPVTSQPYVAFEDAANNDAATVMKFDNSKWVVVGRDSFSKGRIWTPSLAFSDSTGHPFVTYQVRTTNRSYVHTFNGNRWGVVGKGDIANRAADYPDIALHPVTQLPYVAFSDNSQGSGTTVMKYDCYYPVVSFDYTQDTTDMYTFEFTAMTENDTSLKWHFGDGDTSTLPNPTHTYSDTGIYTACLTATNACGDQDKFCRTVIVGDTGTGINTSSPEIGLEIYPNPFTDHLRVQTSIQQSYGVNIYNSYGQLASQRSSLRPGQPHTLELESLPDGLYILQVTTTSDQQVTRKILKVTTP